ncbi:MAG: hypothetical protein WDA23_07240 [Gemmobacter sp.]
MTIQRNPASDPAGPAPARPAEREHAAPMLWGAWNDKAPIAEQAAAAFGGGYVAIRGVFAPPGAQALIPASAVLPEDGRTQSGTAVGRENPDRKDQ